MQLRRRLRARLRARLRPRLRVRPLECHLERPLSRIVALEPSGMPFGATPVEDRGFGADRDAI